MRFYFFEKIDGKLVELDTPFNGKVAVATGGYAKNAAGGFINGTTTSVTLASYADDYVIRGERLVTADDFPGKDVIVKHWYPEDTDAKTEFHRLV